MRKTSKIGVVLHPFRVKRSFIERKVFPVLERHGFAPEFLSPTLNETNPPRPAALPKDHGLSYLMVFGGDGTYLGASRLAARAGIPIIGVEMGKMGFLCQAKLEELEPLAALLASGGYETEKRILLQGSIIRGGAKAASDIALNDVVIGNATIPRMLDLDCYIDDNFLVSYYADGLIVSTPTGSTAYAMAAGGPIIDPTLRTIMVTPICAHSLYIRPLVVPEDKTVRILPEPGGPPLMATFDGQVFYNLEEGDEVRISRYSKPLKMIKLRDFNFINTLMKKFKWGFKYSNEYTSGGA